MKKQKIRVISIILYALLGFCILASIILGLNFVSLKTFYAKYVPISILNGFYIVWFLVILFSFALPVIKRIREEQEKPVSNILFGSGTLLISALLSTFVFFFSTFMFLFYVSLRCGGFHAS